MSNTSLPEGWGSTKLGDVVDSIVGGGTPSKSKPSYYSGNIPWMSVKDMNKHFLTDTVDHITQEAVDNSSTNIIPAGIPIVATRMSLGKVVTASFDSAINQDLKAIFLNANIETSCFLHWYRSSARLIESLGTGTTVKGIRLEILKDLDFPLPPLAEQKEIAARLDDLLAQVDSIKTRLDKLPQILKRFRQSTLAAAVSGKLTEEWRGSASYKQITEFLEVPASWSETKIGHEVEYVTSGSRGWAKFYSDSGSVFIRSQDINTDELIIQDAAFVALPENVEGKRTKVMQEDLLVTITGANVTKCARVKERCDDAYISQHVALIRLEDFAHSPFIELMLKAKNAGRKQLTDMAYGGGKPGLNLQNIKDVEFALPPIEEQTEIVRRVEELFAFADQVEQRVAAAQAHVNHLTQSILAKAFRGELTESWRLENPALITGENSAAALLKRIKSDRKNQTPRKKKESKKVRED